MHEGIGQGETRDHSDHAVVAVLTRAPQRPADDEGQSRQEGDVDRSDEPGRQKDEDRHHAQENLSDARLGVLDRDQRRPDTQKRPDQDPATQGRQTSARREVYDDPRVKKDPILKVFRQQLKDTIPMPNSPAMRKVWTPATIAMNKIINGKLDPQATMVETQKQVKELLKGSRR